MLTITLRGAGIHIISRLHGLRGAAGGYSPTERVARSNSSF